MRRSGSIKIGVGVAVGAPLAAAFLSLFTAGTAAASPGEHVHIVVGGNTDCTSQGATDKIASEGRLQGRPVPVPYSTCDGSFAPFLGSTNAGAAIQQSVTNTRTAWDQNCTNGEICTMEAFSLGDAGVSIVGNDVGADKPGSNTHVITNGNAWGYTGVFGGKPGVVGVGINIGAPFANVPTHIDQVQGSENRNGVNDGWGDNAGQPINAEITQLSCLNGCNGLPPQHDIPAGDPTATFQAEGVTQESFGTPLPGVIPPQDNPIVDPNAVSPVG